MTEVLLNDHTHPPLHPHPHTSPSDYIGSVLVSRTNKVLQRQNNAIVTLKHNATRFVFLFYVIVHLKYIVDFTTRTFPFHSVVLIGDLIKLDTLLNHILRSNSPHNTFPINNGTMCFLCFLGMNYVV